jgi:hypothetical protein
MIPPHEILSTAEIQVVETVSLSGTLELDQGRGRGDHHMRYSAPLRYRSEVSSRGSLGGRLELDQGGSR